MRLTKSIRCPIHNSLICCGRSPKQQMPRRATFNRGVKRIPDETVERGYREIRTPAEMRKLLLVKVREQEGKCYHCGKEFEHIRDVVADHLSPRGMGGSRRDDSSENICASCIECNGAKGSRRDYAAS
jgi:HNH endonuclease